MASVVLLFGVTLLTFVLFYKMPVNPAYGVIGPPRPMPPGQKKHYDELLVKVNHELGADDPVPVQYVRYIQRIMQGSLGQSFARGVVNPTAGVQEIELEPGREVRDILGPAMRVTGWLVVGGVVFLILIAFPLGVLAARNAGSPLDRGILALTIAGISIPPFLVSMFLLYWVAPKIGLQPPEVAAQSGNVEPVAGISGYCPLFGTKPATYGQVACGGVRDWAEHMVLPWIAFALGLLALYARMIRGGVLETLDDLHVRTARAKGASEWRVLRVHVLRTLLPVLLTMLSMDIGMALGIVLFIEYAFNLQGLGATAAQALVSDGGVFDLPVIAGIVLISAAIILTLNLLVDVACAALDPRIRLGKAGRHG